MSASFVCLLVSLTACDRSAEVAKAARQSSTSGQLVSTGLSGRQIVQSSASMYQQLQRYQDNAFVRLLYTLDGQAMEDRAPLEVALDRDANLGLNVYSVQAGPDQGRWRLRLDSNALPIERQVLSRALPQQTSLAWLLDDPFVASSLSAGLAGFPLQLDLLLNPKPMQSVLDPHTQLTLKAPQDVDGELCHVVMARDTLDNEFVLWIGQKSKLLRRAQYPKSALPPQMLADSRVSQIQLTIEFQSIQTQEPINFAGFRPSRVDEDVLVSRFVPSPMRLDTSGMGRRLPAFFLNSPQSKVALQSAESNRRQEILVMVWLADHEACQVAAQQLSRIEKELASASPELSSRIRFVSVWAEPTPPARLSFANLKSEWDLPGMLTLDSQAMGRDLLAVQEAPTLIVLDSQNRLQFRQQRTDPMLEQILPPLLIQLASGADVAGDIIQRAEQEQLRFEAELNMARAIDNQTQLATSSKPYAPVSLAVQQIDSQQHAQAALAFSQDASGNAWRLESDGSIVQLSPSYQEIDTHPTAWQLNATSRLKLIGSSSGRCVVLQDDGRLQFHGLDQQSPQSIRLPATAEVVDLRWIENRQAKPRLAVVTKQQIAVIDPSSGKQFSGSTPVAPVAMLPKDFLPVEADALAVLADGRLEAVQLDTGTAQGVRPELSKELGFQPAAGNWLLVDAPTGGSEESRPQFGLAPGWLAEGEPAAFMVDQQLRQHWHYRLPQGFAQSVVATATIQLPQTGEAVFALGSADGTLHLLKTVGLAGYTEAPELALTGVVADHFRLEPGFLGIALAAQGEQVVLRVVYPQETIQYQVSW